MSDDPGPDPAVPAPRSDGHRLTARLVVGDRVVVRYRLEPGSAARATDFLGELIARNDDFIILDTKTERVKLIRSDVIAAKSVPPPASRPGPAHRRVSVDDLERVMSRGWVAVETGGLGDWMLRSSSGFTKRANSVLVIGDPSLPTDRAIDFAEKWYAEHGAPARFQLPGPSGFLAPGHPVAAALLDRGYEITGEPPGGERVLVMTGLSVDVPELTTKSAPVTAEGVLGMEWLMAYAEQRDVVPGVTEQVLSGSGGQLFLSARDEAGGGIVAVARMSISPGWAGLYSLWVHPHHRRRGLATAITSAIALTARENNMAAIYVQVAAGNAPAIALYESFGFEVHHEYVYLARPTDQAATTAV